MNYAQVNDERFIVVGSTSETIGKLTYITLQYKKPLIEKAKHD